MKPKIYFIISIAASELRAGTAALCLLVVGDGITDNRSIMLQALSLWLQLLWQPKYVRFPPVVREVCSTSWTEFNMLTWREENCLVVTFTLLPVCCSGSQDSAAEEHGPAGQAAVAVLLLHHR